MEVSGNFIIGVKNIVLKIVNISNSRRFHPCCQKHCVLEGTFSILPSQVLCSISGFRWEAFFVAV